MVEESPNPTCYDTNETIDFITIFSSYILDTTKLGKITPFTDSSSLLSANSIKKIIENDYRMFSITGKITSDLEATHSMLSRTYDITLGGVKFYTFAGNMTFKDITSGNWYVIELQMQFFKDIEDGLYKNNPTFGYFKVSQETAISA